MRRTNRKKEAPVRPVQKIELKDENNKGRIILVILLLVIGMGFIGYAIFTGIQTEKGWKQIQANSTEDMNCSEDFVFMYNLGANGESATIEGKVITNLYSDATVEAYKLFTADMGYEDVNNIYYLNQHPNEVVEVEPTLYSVFELLEKYQNRQIYLAPIYAYYDDIYYCKEDYEIVDYDPYLNEDVALYYQEIANFAKDQTSIHIELLENYEVKLVISEVYLQYAEENGITRFIDLHWMKNAFITDYLAESMIEKGYTLGTISSKDGFCRNLDERETTFAFNIFDKQDGKVCQAASLYYSGQQSIVNLRAFLVSGDESQRYYTLADGEVRTNYLDVQDGKCKASIENLVTYSDEMGCAEILLCTIPVYIAEDFFVENLQGLQYVYCEDKKVYYNDDMSAISNLYNHEGVNYEAILVK